METKELKIQAPEDYEIDRENSTLECIKFKPIVLVEHGTIQEVKDAILQNPFLLDKFKKVKEKYKLNIDFLEEK